MSPQPPGSAPPWPFPGTQETGSAKGYVASLRVPRRVESVRPAVTFLVQTARALNVPAAERPLFEVAVNEAIANAVKHGGSADPSDPIVCEIEVAPAQLIVRVIDGGAGFSVAPRALPQISPNQIEALPENGYGVPIIQSVFPIVRAIRSNGRFGLELCLPLL